MINRRNLIKASGAAGLLTLASPLLPLAGATPPRKPVFRFCLNTSTISGQQPGIRKYLDIASRAGYDGIELWVRDVLKFLEEGNSISGLKKLITDNRLIVEGAIGFAPWMVNDETTRKAGFVQMKEEMELMAQLGCTRMAAPPSGVKKTDTLDFLRIGERYRQLLELGRQTGVMPMLEFWGASGTIYHLGQALMIVTAADDVDARILADVFHLFRGGSGFESLKMMKGHIIDLFHMNDYPGNIPREKQTDSDRVYPGDGVAPVKDILQTLAGMGGTKTLSLELFNAEYWKQDPLVVAQTGLMKMKKLAESLRK